jgi:hypothetical protein
MNKIILKTKQRGQFCFDKFRIKLNIFTQVPFNNTRGFKFKTDLFITMYKTRVTIGQGANNLAFGRPPVCIF